jgi:hypothetical protein
MTFFFFCCIFYFSVLSIENSTVLTVTGVSNAPKDDRDHDQLWSREYLPHPLSFILTSILMYSSNFQSLAKCYVQHLPFALKELLYHLCEHNDSACKSLLIKFDCEEGDLFIFPGSNTPLAGSTHSNQGGGGGGGIGGGPATFSRTPSSTGVNPLLPASQPSSASSKASSSKTGVITSNYLQYHHGQHHNSNIPMEIPMWGKINIRTIMEGEGTTTSKKSGINSFSTKSIILQQDIIKLRLVSGKATQETSGFTNTTKRLLMDILESVPSLKRER